MNVQRVLDVQTQLIASAGRESSTAYKSASRPGRNLLITANWDTYMN